MAIVNIENRWFPRAKKDFSWTIFTSQYILFYLGSYVLGKKQKTSKTRRKMKKLNQKKKVFLFYNLIIITEFNLFRPLNENCQIILNLASSPSLVLEIPAQRGVPCRGFLLTISIRERRKISERHTNNRKPIKIFIIVIFPGMSESNLAKCVFCLLNGSVCRHEASPKGLRLQSEVR